MRAGQDITMLETHALFPSGEWEGFYTYTQGPTASQHKMSFVLRFQNHSVDGSGNDDIGRFSWHGLYDTHNLECEMTKYYFTHSVLYKGYVDQNGIWGTWTIGNAWRGGFHIWPKTARENQASEEKITTETEIFL